MFWSELRGTVAVVVVAVVIAVLFVVLLERSGTMLDTAALLPPQTTTTSTTTTIDPRDDARPVVALCEAAQEFVTAAESQAFVWPGKVPQLAETFYAAAYDAAVGDVRPEFAAALAYYEDYNDIAEAGNYDPLTLLKGDTADRYRQLATREPPGVEATRSNVAFLCGGLTIPPPPILTEEELEELENELADELAEEDEDGEGSR